MIARQVLFCLLFGCLLFFGSLQSILSAQGPPPPITPPNNITVQLPVLGVSIDPGGVLTTKLFTDPDGKLSAARLNAFNKQSQNLRQANKLRKVSLRQLESAMLKRLENGEALTEEMLNLAGLQRIEYVFVCPEEKDIVVCGPAEGWIKDLSGRAVGITTGKPVVQLEDFVTAIRAFAPNHQRDTWVACSIDPTPEGLEKFRKFQRELPRQVSMNQRGAVAEYAANGIQKSLGLADIRVHGIDRRTAMAKTMIEADYRMKLIAMGVEPPPVPMKTFIGELKNAPRGMQRWWLTPDYKCVRQSANGLTIQLVGGTVVLNTENIDIQNNGKINKTKTKISSAAKNYARSFTNEYEKISAKQPVFAHLRQIVEVLVVACWLRQSGGYKNSQWTPTMLLDERKYSIAGGSAPKHASCVANAVWKKHRLLLPSGGGVSIQASNALASANILSDKNQNLEKIRTKIKPTKNRWWWD